MSMPQLYKCRPYLPLYPPQNIYSTNIVTINLLHSNFPLSLWKDDNLSISLMKKGKPAFLPQIVLLGITSTNLV